MQHHRYLPRTVFGNILGIQSPWHRKIHLYRAALPDSANTVFQGELDFRPIKGAFAGQQVPFKSFGIQRGGQRGLRLIPIRITTHSLFWAGRKFDNNLVKPEVPINILNNINKINDL